MSGPIITAAGAIPANYLKAGVMTVGAFIAPSKLVQAATAHTVTFTLANALPSKSANPLYNSRILIMMPEIMFVSDPNGLDIVSMDNTLQGLGWA